MAITAPPEPATDARIAALIDQLEIGEVGPCTVPGCVHHPPPDDHQDGDWDAPDIEESGRAMSATLAGFCSSAACLVAVQMLVSM
jgi:hypothetical protein